MSVIGSKLVLGIEVAKRPLCMSKGKCKVFLTDEQIIPEKTQLFGDYVTIQLVLCSVFAIHTRQKDGRPLVRLHGLIPAHTPAVPAD